MKFGDLFKRDVRRKLLENSTINIAHLSIEEVDDHYFRGLRVFGVTIVSDSFVGMAKEMRRHLVLHLLHDEIANTTFTALGLDTVAEYRERNPDWTPGGIAIQEDMQELNQSPKKKTRKRKSRKRGAKNASDPTAV